MFGKWSKRAEKRQRALEELLWLDPVDRERRIVAGVASGEFRADEAESALRLVSRLDSLRSMSLPEGGRLLGGKAVHDASETGLDAPVPFAAASPPRQSEDSSAGELPGSGGPQPVMAGPATSAGDPDPSGPDHRREPGEPVGIPIVPEPVAIPIAPDLISVPVVPEDGDDTTGDASGRVLVPFDALDSAERWLARGRTSAGQPEGRPRTRKTRARKGLGPRVDWPAELQGELTHPASSTDAPNPTWAHTV
jgi:hypothetical protein